MFVRPDLLNVLLLKPGRSNFFPLSKKKIDPVIELMHVASSQMAHLWLSVKVVSVCTVLCVQSLTVPRRKLSAICCHD